MYNLILGKNLKASVLPEWDVSSPSVRLFSRISFCMFSSVYVIRFVLLCYLPSVVQLTLIVRPVLPLQVIARPLPVFVLILSHCFSNAPIPVTCPDHHCSKSEFNYASASLPRVKITGSHQKIENHMKYVIARLCQFLYWSSLCGL